MSFKPIWLLGGKKKTGLRALQDNVIILRDEESDLSNGGIHIPGNATKDKLPTGRVISVGPGKMLKSGKRLPLDVKKGDHVAFFWHKANEIPVPGQKNRVLSVREDDLCGVFED